MNISTGVLKVALAAILAVDASLLTASVASIAKDTHTMASAPEATQPVISETVVLEDKPSDWSSLPDCENEDDVISNGIDCKWDAGSSGNGEGLSFYGRHGEMHYVR